MTAPDWFTDVTPHHQEQALDTAGDVLEALNILDEFIAQILERADDAIVHDPASGREGDVSHGQALAALVEQIRSGR